jgi:hypothetical protein
MGINLVDVTTTISRGQNQSWNHCSGEERYGGARRLSIYT